MGGRGLGAHPWIHHCLPHTQIRQLQLIQNALARAVTNTPRFVHISPILKSLHWLKIKQRTEYKTISLTYTALQQREPRYFSDELNLRPPGSTCSSSLVTLQVPSVKLQTGKRSSSYAAPISGIHSQIAYVNLLPALSQVH